MSGTAKKLASEVGYAMQPQSSGGGGSYGDLFNFRGVSGAQPLLLILGEFEVRAREGGASCVECSSELIHLVGGIDRRNDPVTPLLSQWTYQAMVHELIGIVNGRVRIEDETRPELKVCFLSPLPPSSSSLFLTVLTLRTLHSHLHQETILSPSHDPFFATHLFSNFGDLGASLATYVKDFQSKSLASNPSSIETVADMKRFVEEYPEFRKLGGNVSKHVALVGELSRIVERDGLLGVSEVEQSLASNESHTADLKVSCNESKRI